MDVSACNHPEQNIPEKKFFVCLAIFDAFYQRYKKGQYSMPNKLEEAPTSWKEDVDGYPYSSLFQSLLHFTTRWMGDWGDMDDLSLFEEYVSEYILGFKEQPHLVKHSEQLKTYPKLSTLIESIEVDKEDVFKFDSDGEEYPMKILKINVSDENFIAHCQKNASWEIYWW